MRPRFRVDAAALLSFALLVYFAEGRFLAALLPAVLAHEAGHLLALRLLGRRLREIALEATGLRIAYVGTLDARGGILAAASGPAAGLCWAWLASRCGTALGSDALLLSAGLSLLLSLFNLLPVQPLDGGRIAAELLSLWPGGTRGERLAHILGLITAAALTAAGLGLLLNGRGAALLIAGAVLLAKQVNNEK